MSNWFFVENYTFSSAYLRYQTEQSSFGVIHYETIIMFNSMDTTRKKTFKGQQYFLHKFNKLNFNFQVTSHIPRPYETQL